MEQAHILLSAPSTSHALHHVVLVRVKTYCLIKPESQDQHLCYPAKLWRSRSNTKAVMLKLPHSRKQVFSLYLVSCSSWIDALSSHPSQEWHQIEKPDTHRHTHSLEMPQLLNEWSWGSTKADTMKLRISLHTLTSLCNISLSHELTYQLMWSEHI